MRQLSKVRGVEKAHRVFEPAFSILDLAPYACEPLGESVPDRLVVDEIARSHLTVDEQLREDASL